MCSSTASDTANRLRKTRKKKSSVVPLFRSGHMSAICARLGSKGKAGVQRGRKTAGCPFFAPRRARQRSLSADGTNPPLRFSETPRPLGANPLTQFAGAAGAGERRSSRTPSGQRKEPPVSRCEPSGRTQFVCPGQPVQRKEPPVRANTLTQFAHPAQPVQRKKSRPDRVNLLRGSGAPIARCSEKECRTRTPVHLRKSNIFTLYTIKAMCYNTGYKSEKTNVGRDRP